MKPPEYAPRHAEEHLEVDTTKLQSTILSFLEDGVTCEEYEGTYEIDSEKLRLSFTVEDDIFEIRNIESLEPGLGQKVLSQIHQFANSNKMAVIASNVKDTARSFWERMGYEEGTTEGEFIKN
jgi:hypothetical protein